MNKISDYITVDGGNYARKKLGMISILNDYEIITSKIKCSFLGSPFQGKLFFTFLIW